MRTIPGLVPDDAANRALLANVHPPDWTNPEPAPSYHLVVIGAGTAGLICASVAAGLGARVALVERHLMGGDCLNVGCVPSKSILRSARVIGELRRAAEHGIELPDGVAVDFRAVMARMRGIRARISREDSVRRYTEELGVDVFLGEGRFLGPETLEVEGARLRFRRAVIATGARAATPPVEGLDEVGFLTNETLFSVTERPARLAVIGGGPIGCEMAQAFRRLGSEVTLLEMGPRILPRDDPEASEIVAEGFRREGIRLLLRSEVERVEKTPEGKRVHLRSEGATRDECFDEILVGAGRAPNVEGLGLEAAGVAYDTRRGVQVDARLRTTNRRIFAAGDVCMRWKFTHAADAAAKIVVRNALFPFGRQKVSDLVMPWCTYTDPEVAHVGIGPEEAEAQGIALDTFRVPLERVNRATADGEEQGFVKLHVKKGTDHVVGATIVASHAGEMLSEVTLAITAGLGLGKLAGVIHPYPTQAEGIKAAANAWMRSRFTPRVARLFKLWFSFQG
jgi:pyruvate/2-oxoglutarate dehydrogenase complex dihydrolipoamide dehydrogenase (E3) component